MGRFEDKVVVITGAAQGQGREHAVRFAREGADVVVSDLCEQIPCASPMGSEEGLAETVSLVEETGRRAVSLRADVREPAQMAAMRDAALEAYGRIDVLIANAGIGAFGAFPEMSDETWREMIAINLGGVAHAVRAVAPHMLERGQGRIVATSSEVGREGGPNNANYASAKWGVIGFVKSVAIELAPAGITVNALAPMSVATPMCHNPATYALFRPDLEDPSPEDVAGAFGTLNPMGVPWLDSSDTADAALFLASEEAKYITGVCLDVAGGWNAFHAA
ncbi:MAG: mycofactocin-coupled SDR family oxidoreductase [Solirubrobacterales bacterium]